MATPTTNLLTLNPKPKSSAFSVPSFESVIGGIGQAFNNVNQALPKFSPPQTVGQQALPSTFTGFNPTPAQTASAQQVQSSKSSIPVAPTGQYATQNTPIYNSTNTAGGIGSKDIPAPYTPPTYTGLLSLLQGASAPSATQTGLVSQLANSTSKNTEIGQQAQDIANKYGQQYSDVGQRAAAAKAGYLTTGTTPVAEGNAAVVANTAAQQQQAIAQGEQAALQGIGYQLTGQGQVQSGLTSALGGANTQQGQQITGLNAATGYAQPQLAGIGTQAYYNPLNPGANTGTPFTAGQVGAEQSLGAQYSQNVSANRQATAIKGQINNYLATNPNLNPSVFSDVNGLIQLMSGKTSNPAYQTLSNYLTEYVNTLAPILGVGGDTTNLKTQIAQGFVNAQQSGQSIQSVLDGIENLANAKLQAQAQGGAYSTPYTPTNASTNPAGWF